MTSIVPHINTKYTYMKMLLSYFIYLFTLCDDEKMTMLYKPYSAMYFYLGVWALKVLNTIQSFNICRRVILR